MTVDCRRLEDARRTFATPRELAHSRPRAVRLTAAGRALVGLAVLLFAGAIAAGLGLFRLYARQDADRHALLTDSATARGTVTQLWNGKSDKRRRVQYQFVVDGQPHTGSAQVSRERRAALEEGDAISVRYVRHDPRIHDLGGTPRTMPLLIPIAVPVLIVASGIICLVIVERQRQLLIDGRAAPAIVIGHQRNYSGHGSSHTLTFQFPLLSGAVASGKSSAPKKAPAIGSVVCIVYDPDRPGRNTLYPMSLVTPE